MRKRLLLCLAVLAVSSSAFAGTSAEVKAFEQGLKKGIEVGIKFEKSKLKQELSNYWGIADTIFNYKYLFLSGEVPPPLVVDRTVIRRSPNGVAKIERKLDVLPPAYFPIDRIVALRKTFGSDDIVIPKGFVTYLNAKDIPVRDVAYFSFLAETDGENPIYVPSKDILIFGSFRRKADAEELKERLRKMGINNVDTAFLDEALVIKKPNKNSRIESELKKVAEMMLQKEKAVYGTSAYSFKRSVSGVLYYLQKAIAATDTIDNRRYPDLETVRLKADISKIKIELNKYLAERQPYRGILPEPSYKDVDDILAIAQGSTIDRGVSETTKKVQVKAFDGKPISVKLKGVDKINENIKEIKKLLEGEEK